MEKEASRGRTRDRDDAGDDQDGVSEGVVCSGEGKHRVCAASAENFVGRESALMAWTPKTLRP